jgi:hypothetical protein
MPAKAGIQFLALGPRFRGDERMGVDSTSSNSSLVAQKSIASVFTDCPVTSETSGSGSGVPGSRNRWVIG